MVFSTSSNRLVEHVLSGNYTEAGNELGSLFKIILAKKLVEAKKILAEKIFFDEAHKPNPNVRKVGRLKLIRIRIRGGKVQRRKKISAVKGYTFRKGKLTRMSSLEKMHRRRGARRAKIKRRSEKARIRMRLRRSLRRRKALGLR